MPPMPNPSAKHDLQVNGYNYEHILRSLRNDFTIDNLGRVKYADGFMGGFDSACHHCAESWSHPIRAIMLRQFHTYHHSVSVYPYTAPRLSSPVIINPGTTSRVPFTIAGSARFISKPLMFPSSFNKPVLTSRLAEKAPMGPSWPVAEITTGAVMVLGSMQDWVSCARETSVQFVTTPPTRWDPEGEERMMRSSTAVAFIKTTCNAVSDCRWHKRKYGSLHLGMRAPYSELYS